MAKNYDELAAQFGGSTAPVDKAESVAAEFGGRAETPQERGAKLNSSLRSAMNILNAPTFGFADELYGRLAPGDYQENRDLYRGAVDSFKKEYPGSAMLGTVSGSMLSGGPLAGLIKRVPSALTGVVGGGAYGALNGAGESTSETPAGIAADTAYGAVTGGALGGVNQAGVAGINAVANNIAQRMGNQPSINQLAMNRVAEAVGRDEMTGNQVAARLNKFGDRGVIADAGGANTRNLLDTMAIQPGQTGNRVENLIRDRQKTRGTVLRSSAEDALGVNGQRLPETLESLDSLRSQMAGPMYDQVRNTSIQLTPELTGLLDRASGAFGRAKQIAKINGQPFDLGADAQGLNALLGNSQRAVPLSQLDTLKRTLYDMEQKNINPETGRLNEMGEAYKGLRRQLVGELDRVTTDPRTGESFYKQARDVYAGATELRHAANLGNQAMSKDTWKIQEMTDGMSLSEQEAFKVGAFEALRKKLGAPNGQTEILNMWKNDNMREKLQAMFGDFKGFRQFARDVAAEGRIKNLDSVGRGSQTAGREARIDDVNAQVASDLAGAASAIKTGNPASMLSSVRNLWGRVSTPETVRNEIGNILLKPNSQEAQYLLQNLNAYQAAQRARSASRGAYSGLLGGMESKATTSNKSLLD